MTKLDRQEPKRLLEEDMKYLCIQVEELCTQAEENQEEQYSQHLRTKENKARFLQGSHMILQLLGSLISW